MEYEEAMDAVVTAAEARAEIRRHKADWDEFVAEVGDKPEYDGSDVLDWLGY